MKKSNFKSDLHEGILGIKHFYLDNKKLVNLIIVLVVIIVAIGVFFLNKNSEEQKLNRGTYKSSKGRQVDYVVKEKNKKSNEELDDLARETEDQEDDREKGDKSSPLIIVDIGGQVKNPGVYQVKYKSRLNDVIKEAGGMTSSADKNRINRAEEVTDGEKIYIPKVGEEDDGEHDNIYNNIKSSMKDKKEIININKSNESELEKIPGIGPSMAKRIIEYRQENGKFRKIEDLQNIKGIGDKTFEKIKSYIKV